MRFGNSRFAYSAAGFPFSAAKSSLDLSSEKEQLLIRVILMHADCKQKHIFSRIYDPLSRLENP